MVTDVGLGQADRLRRRRGAARPGAAPGRDRCARRASTSPTSSTSGPCSTPPHRQVGRLPVVGAAGRAVRPRTGSAGRGRCAPGVPEAARRALRPDPQPRRPRRPPVRERRRDLRGPQRLPRRHRSAAPVNVSEATAFVDPAALRARRGRRHPRLASTACRADTGRVPPALDDTQPGLAGAAGRGAPTSTPRRPPIPPSERTRTAVAAPPGGSARRSRPDAVVRVHVRAPSGSPTAPAHGARPRRPAPRAAGDPAPRGCGSPPCSAVVALVAARACCSAPGSGQSGGADDPDADGIATPRPAAPRAGGHGRGGQRLRPRRRRGAGGEPRPGAAGHRRQARHGVGDQDLLRRSGARAVPLGRRAAARPRRGDRGRPGGVTLVGGPYDLELLAAPEGSDGARPTSRG